MEKQYIIYRIIDLINRKFYIGQTSKSLDKRWSVHKAHAKYGEKYTKNKKKSCGDTYLYRAMRKYGIENFEIKQIDMANDFKHMRFLEKLYIQYYNSTDSKYGYNLTIDGYGDGREYISKETREKASLNTYLSHDVGAGILWDKSRNKWIMKFKNICKRFEDKSEAKEARDKLSLFFYGGNAKLNFPEKKNEYISHGLQKFYNEISKKRRLDSGYIETKANGVGSYMVRTYVKNTRKYFGSYRDEKEAAIVRDKIVYYLWGTSKKFNFPELVNESYQKEGKDVYDTYMNLARQRVISGGKTSKFNGVSRRSPQTWEMSFCSNGVDKIREVYLDEQCAAKAYDFYLTKNGGDAKKLNFPNEKILEKPISHTPKPRVTKQKTLSMSDL